MSLDRGDIPPQSSTEAERRRAMIWEINTSDEDAYFEAQAADIRAGKMTWVARNFDSDFGRVFDLAYKFKPIGYLDAEYGEDVVGYIYIGQPEEHPIIVPGSLEEVMAEMERVAKKELGDDKDVTQVDLRVI